MNLANEKKKALLRIERAKALLNLDLNNGLIKEEDLADLVNYDSNYGTLNNTGTNNYKNMILKQIFNSPFLLYDQNLSPSAKKVLLTLIKKRYKMELDEIEYLYDSGDLSVDEYLDQKELIKFCYFNSLSKDKKESEKTKKHI